MKKYILTEVVNSEEVKQKLMKVAETATKYEGDTVQDKIANAAKDIFESDDAEVKRGQIFVIMQDDAENEVIGTKILIGYVDNNRFNHIQSIYDVDNNFIGDV